MVQVSAGVAELIEAGVGAGFKGVHAQRGRVDDQLRDEVNEIWVSYVLEYLDVFRENNNQ